MKRLVILLSAWLISATNVGAFAPISSSLSTRISLGQKRSVQIFQSTNDDASKKEFESKKNRGIGDEAKDISSRRGKNRLRKQRKQQKPVLGIPDYKTMIVFVATTIIIWLSEPLLSLVDTTVVGQVAKNAVVQLAALGPATMLVDSAIFMTYFLSIATTNTMAKALAQNDNAKLQKSSSQVLGLAACLGAFTTFVLFAFGKPMLAHAAGTSASPELIQLAFDYCRIRIAVAPFAIMGMVAQSICLACLDTKTPAQAVAAASAVNLVGDIFLVKNCNMGIQGAAVATAMASVVATVVLMQEVVRKMKEWRIQRNGEANGSTNIALVVNGLPILDANAAAAAQESQNAMKETEKETDENDVPILSLPNQEELWDLVKMAGPIFFVMFGKIICYNQMTFKVADFGVAALASHNIMMRIFFFFGTFGDSVSQASQTFLPKVIANKSKRGAIKLIKRLGVLATFIGIFNLGTSRLILRRFGSYFTNEGAILSMMARHSKFMPLALLLHPFIMLFEGAALAAQDLIFLVFSYALTMALLFSQLHFQTKSFGGVWVALFIFQSLRALQFSLRVWNKTIRGTERDEQTSLQAQPI